jgi:hypothetical protein
MKFRKPRDLGMAKRVRRHPAHWLSCQLCGTPQTTRMTACLFCHRAACGQCIAAGICCDTKTSTE